MEYKLSVTDFIFHGHLGGPQQTAFVGFRGLIIMIVALGYSPQCGLSYGAQGCPTVAHRVSGTWLCSLQEHVSHFFSHSISPFNFRFLVHSKLGVSDKYMETIGTRHFIEK